MAIIPGLQRLKTGDFNNMSQEWQADGSVVITLSSRRYPDTYKIRIRNLYGPDEEIVDAEIFKGRLEPSKEISL